MLGKTEGKRRRVQQRIRWLDYVADSMDMNLSKLGDGGGQKGLACCSPWGHTESDMPLPLKNNNIADSLCCAVETNTIL